MEKGNQKKSKKDNNEIRQLKQAIYRQNELLSELIGKYDALSTFIAVLSEWHNNDVKIKAPEQTEAFT